MVDPLAFVQIIVHGAESAKLAFNGFFTIDHCKRSIILFTIFISVIEREILGVGVKISLGHRGDLLVRHMSQHSVSPGDTFVVQELEKGTNVDGISQSCERTSGQCDAVQKITSCLRQLTNDLPDLRDPTGIDLLSVGFGFLYHTDS